MAKRLSRRVLAQYASECIQQGDDTVVSKLAAYLIETKRTNEALLLVRDIETALAAAGIVIADIAVANDMSAALEKEISTYVERVAGAHEVQLRTHVDPTLIGGMRLRTPDAELDASIRRQLMKLQAMKV